MVPEKLTVPARAHLQGEVAAERAIKAILRLTGRETSDAMNSGTTQTSGRHRKLVALRAKARLTHTELARANALIDELVELMRSAKPRHRSADLFALTIVLTPAHDGGRATR